MDNGQNTTMEQMMADLDESFKMPRRGEIVRGKIVLVGANELAVNVGYKSDGIVIKSEISNDEIDLKSTYNVGDEIDVMVVKLDDGNGNVQLSIKRLKQSSEWTDLEQLYAEEKEVEVLVKEATKGGLIAYYNDIKGFIPASLISYKHVDKLDEYVGKTYTVKIIEFNRKRNKVVFSRKDLAMQEQAKVLEATWDKLNVGEKIQGEVKRIADFGAFVDLGGVDGLIHNTEISWARHDSAKASLKVGEVVEALILAADKETGKVSLSIKQLTPNPWTVVESNYNLEDSYEGKVVSVVDFGAFVELESGLEGLVHISQISTTRVEKVSDVLKVGDTVNVKILGIDVEGKKLKLSIKATIEDSMPEESPVVEEAEVEEAVEAVEVVEAQSSEEEAEVVTE